MSRTPSNPNVGLLAAGIFPTLGALRQAAPPIVQRFARALGSPKLLRFLPLDTSTDDGWTAVVPNAGSGAWLGVPEDDRGEDLTPANGYASSGSWTIGAYGGPWRVIPAGTLTGAVAVTLDPHNLDGVVLQRGEHLLVTRLDTSANAVTVGSLCTLPPSQASFAWLWFDGSAWVKRAAAVML